MMCTYAMMCTSIRSAAGVLGAFHLILSIGLGVSLMQLDDSWRRGDGEDPSVIIFFVLAIAATGVNQIFTAFYPGMDIVFGYSHKQGDV